MGPREEFEKFLRITAKLAEAQLQSNNRMHFGAVFDLDGNVRMLVPNSMKENVTWDELVTYWKRELGKAALAGPWRAVASCVFSSYCAFGEFSFQEAIASVLEIRQSILIHAEHRDPTLPAEDVAFPYEGRLGSKVRMGQPTRATAIRWLSAPPLAQG